MADTEDVAYLKRQHVIFPPGTPPFFINAYYKLLNEFGHCPQCASRMVFNLCDEIIPFTEGHPYIADPVLPSLLKRTLPEAVFQQVQPDLVRLGNEVIPTMRSLGRRTSPPTLTQYNQWGQRIDYLETSEGWRALKDLSQREGIPAIFYERTFGEHSRTYGFAKSLLMIGDGQVVFCPLSMSDGCARVLELYGTPKMKQEIFPRLISRDPAVALTSGQWMTERPGGSDVSQTETVAKYAGENAPLGPKYTVDGFKWFSSATDSDVAVALARTGSIADGSRGLSLFLIPLRLHFPRNPGVPATSSTSNGIHVHRLKNKIGTHALPTAELSLDSAEGYLLGPLNEGVKHISQVLNITRIHSAFASLGNLRKCLTVATSYANVRNIYNKNTPQLLSNTPLHVSQLASINVTYRAIAHLTFGAARLLGKTECGTASEGEEARLRLLTPVVKAFAAEKCVSAMEEAMSALGGAGYIEENGIGRVIRDGLVEKIWEGTTTVLSLDLVRAAREPSILTTFLAWSNSIVSSCPAQLKERLHGSLTSLASALLTLSSVYTIPIPPLLPRPALFLLGHTASSVYLLEHAIWSFINKEFYWEADIEVFDRWVVEGGLIGAVEDVARVSGQGETRIAMDKKIVFGCGKKIVNGATLMPYVPSSQSVALGKSKL